ncbi:unnamed protein product [Larinioides sclopetarius]|uniref:Uncharacterized protein n=1 Tax=Larinioides sclopetarius TaxID=280406 RepID=A0AAV1Z175_9ARAC
MQTLSLRRGILYNFSLTEVQKRMLFQILKRCLLKVGVYNRRTRQFKLHDADFFHLKPLLKCRVDVNNSQKSWSEKTQDLALTFGSKNRKRVISSRLKYESAANDTISHDKVQSSISSETTITEENKEECQIIPPQNKNANRVDEIYNIYDDPFPDIPQPYKSSLMEKYLVNRSLPQRMKDKILSHAMVLALTINNYYIDGKLLASSTHVPMTRIVLVAYSLGCHVKDRKAEGTKLIELTLPLFKYEPKGKQRK